MGQTLSGFHLMDLLHSRRGRSSTPPFLTRGGNLPRSYNFEPGKTPDKPWVNRIRARKARNVSFPLTRPSPKFLVCRETSLRITC